MTTDEDARHLRAAVELSLRFLDAPGLTPCGAVVVRDGVVLGRGVSSVVRDQDPTAHAEVNALRQATRRLGHHLLEGATVYCSSEPCPLCYAACLWAEVTRIVYAAPASEVARAGFQDSSYWQAMARPAAQRPLPVEHAVGLQPEAVEALEAWARRRDGP